MRRLLALMVMLGMLCLPGCTEKRMTQEELLLSFCCRVSVEYAGETYDCRIERQGPGVVTVRTSLIGYHWQGEFFSQTCAGLESVSESCPLPESSFAVQLNRYLDALHKNGSLTAVAPSSFEGSLEGKTYTVEADPETGQLRELTVPQMGFTARFYEYDS